MIPAIPTLYNGVQFRSRLEARWAALFDLVGWSWEYEPIDLAGYIPDFRIGYGAILAEVKPTNMDVSHGISHITGDPDWEKIRWCESESPVRLMLGSGLPGMGHDGRCCLLASSPTLEVGHNLLLIATQIEKHRYVLRCARRGEVNDMDLITGDTGEWGNTGTDLSPAWREAGNLVQWRRPV